MWSKRYAKIFLLVGAAICILTISLYLPRKRTTIENERGTTSGFENFEHVTPEFEKMEVANIRLSNDQGNILELEVKVADEPDERAAGFQYISRSVIERSLILFVFPEETHALFHMRNVEASLDIGFFRADGTVVDILRMEPDNRLYGPAEAFKYALEARAGFFAEKGIGRSSRLLVESLLRTAEP
jgi:uncharacterized membrane protein (UPF0127 family)